jgi:hypothetical protein
VDFEFFIGRALQTEKLGTQAELQAVSSLLNIPVYMFQNRFSWRGWCTTLSRSQLDFSACPGLATLQPLNTFNIAIFYHITHFDVIARTKPTIWLLFLDL